ncbi:MAG: type VI secretion system-associated protein TagF [Myxococcales bacterium]|nr:type VI secretion system-associated protein TagF [Myxococcales bacterium]
MHGESVGIYGKLPTQGDFVRVNASDPAAQSLDLWVQESLEQLQRAGAELPREATFFCYQGPHPALPVLLGAMAPSRDSVGRVYPVLIFTRIDPQLAAARLSALHVGYGRFLLDAARMLGDLDRADGALLAAWSRNMRLPSPELLAQADRVCMHVLGQSLSGDLQARVFGADAMARWHYAYALKTVVDGCDSARARPSRLSITLDCPVGSDLDGFAWLEMIRRRLYGSQVRPSFVWREGAAPRLLVALGAATPTMLKQLARPADQAQNLWPLRAGRAEALEQAWAAMAPHHRQVLETPALPLEHLFAQMAR